MREVGVCCDVHAVVKRSIGSLARYRRCTVDGNVA